VIGVRRLRLTGLSEDYLVDLCDEDGNPRSLAIIAGEISTGKTAVLEFIDYCLGKGRHPAYVEIERQARSAQLEVDLSGEICVIERTLFASENVARIHHCRLAGMGDPHGISKVPLGPAGNPESLNWTLLANAGLEGVILKEAPTQAASGVDPLSFRDVMWLSFLDSDRMLARHNLLFESADHMKRLKLKQLIEVTFGVHDQELASIADRVRLVERERESQKAEIASLETFLREQEVPDRLEVQALVEAHSEQLGGLRAELGTLDEEMRAASDFADAARRRYGSLRREAGLASVRIRDRDTLLRRLLPLRAQYAEDERKLVFYGEAKQLFDPLHVTVCPSCLQELDEVPEIERNRCTLCGSEIETGTEEINVEAERAAIRTRLRAISRYIEEVEEQLGEDRGAYERLSAAESDAQAEMDSDMSEQLAPFVAQRDQLVRAISDLGAERRHLQRQLGWIEGVERRTRELETLQKRIAELRDEQRALEEDRPSRDAVVGDLSARFGELLRAFGFPKLDDPVGPSLDSDFVPHVRGSRYDEIGSRGGITLVALAWQLAIFERAIELGRPHPGFLMIDSPQTNLRPPDQEPDEFSTEEIGARLWHHLHGWSNGPGRGAQLIVVDHRPPAEVWGAVVAAYSGRADRPPYGLIANETGANTAGSDSAVQHKGN
jgi:hypothetical protein